MKIGVLQFFGWADRSIPLQSVYERAIERFEIMDQTGYDAVWLAEHHFSGFSVCPSVHMMATMAAARTQRLRIGTAVSLAPFYHPLRLAEEIALRIGADARRDLYPRIAAAAVLGTIHAAIQYWLDASADVALRDTLRTAMRQLRLRPPVG